MGHSIPSHHHHKRPDRGTSNLTLSPHPGPVGVKYIDDGDNISYELQDAPPMCVVTTMHVITYREMRVLAWLRDHKHQIVAAEQEFRVDRRAIAGAIAYEAIENPRSKWTPSSVGDAKVHIHPAIQSLRKIGIYIPNMFSDDTVVKQAEDEGYLPKRTLEQRKKDLATHSGAIKSIAGIMAAGSDVAAERGYDIRCNPGVLTHFFQGPDLNAWKKHLAEKSPPQPLQPTTTMALWVISHLEYLQDAVGAPDLPECNVACPLQLSLLPQETGHGYYSYSPVDRQYGTAHTIEAVRDVAGTFARNRPKLHIGIGDISFEHGGAMKPHRSHRRGTDVDVRPLRKDGQEAPVTITDPQYSHNDTKLLVQSFLAHKNVKRILFNDGKIHGVHHFKGHDNHMHVEMKA